MTDKITEMEATIEALMAELENRPAQPQLPRTGHGFKPGWFLVTIIVAVLIGTLTYFAVSRLSQVDKNARAINEKCQFGNQQVTIINEKMQQLNLLIEASIKSADEVPSPQVAQAYETLRQPIALKSCD